MTGARRGFASKLREWFFRDAALAEAEAPLPRPGALAGRAFEQAQLLREIAKGVAEPVEQLPGGRRSAVLLGLHRDLVYWALVAGRKGGDGEAAPDLETLWEQTPADRLLRAAGSADNLEAVRSALVERPPPASLDTTEADAARAQRFGESLYQELQLPRRRVDRVVTVRWLRLGGAAVAVLALALVGRAVVRGPDLAEGRPFRTSSTLPNCATDPGCAERLFHTSSENNPWVEFDLGATKRVHLVEVRNRIDCCQDRSVPLVVELSNDRRNWKQVDRREAEFTTWTATFPRTPARYVRLRVPKVTMFHLDGVEIH